jgi:hypothetical protein
MPTGRQREPAKLGWGFRGSIPTACSTCGTPMRIYLSRVTAPRHFCSLGCYKKTLTGAGNPNFQNAAHHAKCQSCGNEFARYGKISRKNPIKYCSKTCATIGSRKYDSPRSKRLANRRLRELALRAHTAPGEHHTEQQWLGLLAKCGGKCGIR